MRKEVIITNNDKPKDFWRTTDIFLVSALVSILNYEIQKIEINSQNGRGIFYLKDNPNRVEHIRNYFDGKLSGSIKRFVNVFSDLKHELRNMS